MASTSIKGTVVLTTGINVGTILDSTNLYRIRNSKRLQCFHGYNPGRNTGSKILGQEWTKWDVLPLLDITSFKMYIIPTHS
jgi:hypothetical protein